MRTLGEEEFGYMKSAAQREASVDVDKQLAYRKK